MPLKGALAGLVLGTTAATPSRTFIEILLALLSGSLLSFGAQLYLRWRKGPIDDALQLQQATDLARRASGEMFTQYRVELEDAKAQLSQYLDQLLRVQRDLGAAEARINRLEHDLNAAHGEGRQLRTDLEAALAARERLEHQVDALRSRVSELQEKLGPEITADISAEQVAARQEQHDSRIRKLAKAQSDLQEKLDRLEEQ